MTHPRSLPSLDFGPRLIREPAGTLRAAAVVPPSPGIEHARPLNAEPGAVYARALEQHAVLQGTLRYFGVEVTAISPSGEDPYGAAVCEAAVLFESGAVMMRPTSMTRRVEVERVEDTFSAIDVPLCGRIVAPGLLDGTDVLLVDSTAFVGVSGRANEVGRHGFMQVARAQGFSVVEVELAPGVASLQSVAGVLGRGVVVLAPEKLDVAAFSHFETVLLDRGEESAAGVICLGDRHVIADVRYRTALRRMRKAGVTVEGLDLYEFEKIGITPSMLVLPIARD